MALSRSGRRARDCGSLEAGPENHRRPRFSWNHGRPNRRRGASRCRQPRVHRAGPGPPRMARPQARRADDRGQRRDGPAGKRRRGRARPSARSHCRRAKRGRRRAGRARRPRRPVADRARIESAGPARRASGGPSAGRPRRALPDHERGVSQGRGYKGQELPQLSGRHCRQGRQGRGRRRRAAQCPRPGHVGRHRRSASRADRRAGGADHRRASRAR